MKQLLSRIENTLKVDRGELTSIYLWGSRAYKTHTTDSDFDIICVGENFSDGREYRNGDLNLHTVSVQTFQNNLTEHKIREVECFFLPRDNYLMGDYIYDFHLDLKKLRHIWSAVSSNSWVKAKKKINVEKEWYIGIKSLFHSLRILNFATQLAVKKQINFTAANYLWDEIKKTPVQPWETIQTKWQPIYNEHCSEFRKIAPK